MHRFLLIAAAGAAAFLTSARAEADLIRFTFSGTVIAVTGEGTPPPEAEIGAVFTVSFLFDPSVPDTDPSGNFGFYDGAVHSAAADMGGLVVQATGGFITVLNNGFVGDTLFYESETDEYRVQASLTDIQRTAIDGDALPDDIDFWQWDLNRLYLGDVGLPGSWTAVGEITSFTREVVAGGCPADWNGDAAVNSNDISAYLSAWLDSVQNGDLVADFDGSGGVNSNDISAFLAAWLDAVQGGC